MYGWLFILFLFCILVLVGIKYDQIVPRFMGLFKNKKINAMERFETGWIERYFENRADILNMKMSELYYANDILKRLYTRYYPGIALLSLLSLYGAYIVFPGKNIPLIILMFHASQWIIWLLIAFAIAYFRPVSCLRQVMLIAGTALVGVFFCHGEFVAWVNILRFDSFPSSYSTNIFIMMFLVGVICSGSAILAERSLRIEKEYEDEKTRRLMAEKKLAEDQLNLLQAQIEPQFLFNTMESICHLYDSDPKKANATQMYFIQYLRTTLLKARSGITTIEQEMDHIRLYMDIFKVGMESRFKYRIDADWELKNLQIPPMIVHPIVENLIRDCGEMGNEEKKILITVKKREGMVHISIADTAERLDKESGIEEILGNIEERLKTLYEDKGVVTFGGNRPTGIVVDIEVPCG